MPTFNHSANHAKHSQKTLSTPAEPPLAAPVQIVVFGLTGDLARKKLLPAFYHLLDQKALPAGSRIIGVTRRDVTAAEVLAGLHDDPAFAAATLERLTDMVTMFHMDLAAPDDYARLKDLLDRTDETHGQCSHRLLYLSMPPQVFAPVITRLGEAGLAAGCPHGSGKSRLLIEKPFGYDQDSAAELINIIAAQFSEDQIFRIDHYVAKDTVQNILTFRAQNPLFAAVWDQAHVESITVSATETIGAEGRLSYDGTGALRDVIQNHLLQLLALTTMELPAGTSSDALHAAKLELLKSIATIQPGQAKRGQYAGYRDEVQQPESITETFAAIQLVINNPRWQGVPVLIQTGKSLDQKATEVMLTFKQPGAPAHEHHPALPPNDAEHNTLTIRLEPDEGICLDLRVKQPGLAPVVQTVDMDFRYARSFSHRQPDAYERVLSDAIRGDRTLFTTSAETLECWRIINDVVTAWTASGTGLAAYKPGAAAATI
jgi:glucose-6-phosphate 1-dehydrogenase